MWQERACQSSVISVLIQIYNQSSPTIMFTTTELFGPFHSPRAPKALERARAAAPQELQLLFGSCLPPGLLSQTEEGPNSRQRVYTVIVTFWTFLWQVLNPGSSARSAVRKVMAWFALL